MHNFPDLERLDLLFKNAFCFKGEKKSYELFEMKFPVSAFMLKHQLINIYCYYVTNNKCLIFLFHIFKVLLL